MKRITAEILPGAGLAPAIHKGRSILSRVRIHSDIRALKVMHTVVIRPKPQQYAGRINMLERASTPAPRPAIGSY